MNITKQIEIIDLVLNAIKENNANEFFRVRDGLYFAFFEHGYDLKESFIDLIPANNLGAVSHTLNSLQKSSGFSSELIDGAGGRIKLDAAIKNLEYVKDLLVKKLKETPAKNALPDSTINNIGDIESTNEENLPLLVRNLVFVCRKMQKNHTFFKLGTHENERNTQVKVCLELMDYDVDDQTLQGRSASGLGPGEIDLLVTEKETLKEIVVEGLNLTYCDTSTIKNHFNKIFGYDTFGNVYNVELIYCNIKNLDELKKNYIETLNNFKDADNPTDNITEITTQSSRLFILRSHQLINNKDNYIYHILIQFVDF